MTDYPILYSFRRCPYAMRARLAVANAGIQCELREILLRDKAPDFLKVSPSKTVPCLVDGADVLDESIDIMAWALAQNDPDGWLDMPALGTALIEEADGSFKTALDRYKYASRFDTDASSERDFGGQFIVTLDEQIGDQAFLFGDRPTLADMAILPFIRQFAHVDLDWFQAQPWPSANRWLGAFKASDLFLSIMTKYPKWAVGDDPTGFPKDFDSV